MNDFRFAFRQLLKFPGFTTVAVLTLAVGIGANTVVFSWIQGTLLDAIPGAAETSRLMVVAPRHKSAGLNDTMSLADIATLREATNIFAGIAGSQFEILPVRLGGEPEWVWTQPTEAEFFDVLGVRPALGRAYHRREGDLGANDFVAVISDQLWRRKFQGAPDVIGRVIEVNERPVTIIGVAPPEFRGTMGGLGLDLWVPLAVLLDGDRLRQREDDRGSRWMHTVARLREDVSRSEAEAAAGAVGLRLASAFPETNRDRTFAVLRLWDSPWGGQGLFLPLLRALALVALLLLGLVAANMANLLIVRAQAREQEVAVRIALGAAPRRILRQFLTESVLLAVLGGLAGVAFAAWGTRWLTALMPATHLPIAYAMHLDGTTLAVTAALTLVTGIIFGLLPAARAAWTNLNAVLKSSGRAVVGAGARPWVRGGLVAGQIALAAVLLIGMGLCVRSFAKAQQIDVGMNPRNLWVAGFRINANSGDPATINRLYRQLRQEVARLPGVESVALADWLPLGFEDGSTAGVKIPGYTPVPGESMAARTGLVSPGYLETMGIYLQSGRDFREADAAATNRVVVVNQAFADRFFAGRDPVGLTINFWGRDAQIIGVTKTGKYRALNEPPQPYFYALNESVTSRNLTLIARTQGNPAHMAKAIARAAMAIDPRLTPYAGLTYETYMAAALAVPRMAAILLTGLGLAALGLAAMGIYAVISQTVLQRRREIGVRLALGARPAEIVRLILQQGLVLSALGLGGGILGGLVVSRLLAGLLVGVSVGDLATWILVPLLLLVTAGLTCWWPARRASRIDPVIALRAE